MSNKRGRPLGSKNKTNEIKNNISKLNKSSYKLVKFEKQIENSPITKDSNRGWISWGQKNDYPYQLLNLYNESPTHAACVNFAVTSIIGDGIDYEAMSIDSGDLVPNYQYSWNDFIKFCALDYILYGSFAFQIIKNKDNSTYSYYHQPMDTIRCAPLDEDGVITSYFISDDWTAINKNQPIELPRFGFTDDEEIKQGEAYIFVYNTYNPTNKYYNSPKYISAIKAIQSEVKYLNYDLKSISNGFVATGMLTLSQVEDDEERDALLRDINQMFIGDENANSLLVNFKHNGDDEPAIYTPFTQPTNSVDLYEAANERTINRIMGSHSINNKALIGYPMDSSGFSSQAEMLEVSYNLYNKNAGNDNRLNIIGAINNALKLNGIDTELILKPLTFLDTKIEDNDTSTVNINDDISNDNIEEQQTNLN